MATKLKSFDFTTPSPSTGEKAVYDWDEWFDGDIWALTAGEDFQGHPLMMERIIRTRATARKAKIRLRHVSQNGDQFGTIVIQRWDIEGPDALKKAARAEKAAATRAAKKAGAAPTEAKPTEAKPTKTKSKRPA